ncbi:hypothetical protein GCM10027614_33160 [Micromonospora vulcania]
MERVLLDPAEDFRLDPARVPADADLVMIGNPTNPTSVLHPAQTVAALARPGRVLVVDEAFADTTAAPGLPGEPASLADRRDLPGLLVVRSLTKTWGLAGLRIGYLLGAPELLSRLAAVQPLWAVSTPALAAASACATPSRSRPNARSPPNSPPTATTWSPAWPTCPVYASSAARPAHSCCCTGPERCGCGRPCAIGAGRYAGATPSRSRPGLAAGGGARPVHHRHVHRRAARDHGGMTLETTIAAIRPPDASAMAAARELHGRLTKPAGSLGALEELSVRLAGLAAACPPPLPEPAAVAIFAGDHGVHAQGVTPWPQEVTGQMIGNFLAGGAVVNAFARQAGASVTVVDVGVATPLPAGAADASGPAVLDPSTPRLVAATIRRGTRDLAVTAALTRDEARAAVQTGIRIADELIDAGAGILLTGDMGIGNTTPAAALVAAFTGADPADATGRGTGVDDPTYTRKVAVVRAALARHQPDPANPLGVLAAVGGLEHAALAGLILGAAPAAHRCCWTA